MTALKIVVFSDSHGNSSQMVNAVYDETPDAVIHLGDGCRDCDALSFFEIPIYKVCGNNDFCAENRENILTFSGKKLFFTHGHYYNVRSSPSALIERAMSLGADAVLFGHTHTPLSENTGRITVLNPGTVGYKGSYGVIEIENGKIKTDIKTV